MRRVLVVLALLASTTVGVVLPGARGSAGAAARLFQGLVAAGVPIEIRPGSHLRTAIQVAYRPDGFGVVYLHECGAAPEPGDVAIVAAEASSAAGNVALIPADDSVPALSCLTPTAPGLLIIDALDTFPLGNFTPVSDAPQQTITIGPDATVEIGLPVAIPDSMVATMLIRGTGTTDSFVTVWPSGPRPLEAAIRVALGDGDVSAWAVHSGTERRIRLYNQAGTATVTLQFTGWYDFEIDGTGEMPLISWQPEEGAGFHQQVPTRLLDTRQTGGRLPDGGMAAITFPGGQEAVALNVTLADAGGEGFATAWPCAEPRPLASNLNFVAGDEVANAVIATTDQNGQVCFYASAPTDLVVDQSGWFGAGGDAYTPSVVPFRMLDTRVGIGASGPLGPFGSHDDGLALPLDFVASTGATTAVFNVTVTEPVAAGFAVAWPCGLPRPNASNVNFGIGETVPNLVTVPIGAGGSVCFYTSATAHLIADLQGWYSAGGEARYEPRLPSRWFDTRDEGPPPAINKNRVQPLFEEPDVSVRAAVINTTVTEPAADGFATVWPCTPNPLAPQFDPPRPPDGLPNASNLNYVAGQTVPNLIIGRLAPEYTGTCFFASQSTHLLADVSGLFVAGPVSASAVGGNAYLGGGAALRAPLADAQPDHFAVERSR